MDDLPSAEEDDKKRKGPTKEWEHVVLTCDENAGWSDAARLALEVARAAPVSPARMSWPIALDCLLRRAAALAAAL